MNRDDMKKKARKQGKSRRRVENMFVYGTLRHNKSRGNVLAALEYKKAVLPNHRKVSPETLGFPFIIQDESSEVQGEVYFGVGKDLIRQIDMIEGEGNLYNRIVVEVTTEDGEKVKAYTYYPSDRLVESYT
jgi:gamma-glutamylcyclotransferase (GGCT)/AIG2-like uncharacterized protein YtfP